MKFDEVLSKILSDCNGQHEQMLDGVAEFLSRHSSLFANEYKTIVTNIFSKYEKTDKTNKSIASELDESSDDELLASIVDPSPAKSIKADSAHGSPLFDDQPSNLTDSVLVAPICSRVNDKHRASPDVFMDDDDIEIPETQPFPENEDISDDGVGDNFVDDDGAGENAVPSNDDNDEIIQVHQESQSSAVMDDPQSQVFGNISMAAWAGENRRKSCINNKTNDSISLTSAEVSANMSRFRGNHTDVEMSQLKWDESSNLSATAKTNALPDHNHCRSTSTTPDLLELAEEPTEAVNTAGSEDEHKTDGDDGVNVDRNCETPDMLDEPAEMVVQNKQNEQTTNHSASEAMHASTSNDESSSVNTEKVNNGDRAVNSQGTPIEITIPDDIQSNKEQSVHKSIADANLDRSHGRQGDFDAETQILDPPHFPANEKSNGYANVDGSHGRQCDFDAETQILDPPHTPANEKSNGNANVDGSYGRQCDSDAETQILDPPHFPANEKSNGDTNVDGSHGRQCDFDAETQIFDPLHFPANEKSYSDTNPKPNRKYQCDFEAETQIIDMMAPKQTVLFSPPRMPAPRSKQRMSAKQTQRTTAVTDDVPETNIDDDEEDIFDMMTQVAPTDYGYDPTKSNQIIAVNNAQDDPYEMATQIMPRPSTSAYGSPQNHANDVKMDVYDMPTQSLSQFQQRINTTIGICRESTNIPYNDIYDMLTQERPRNSRASAEGVDQTMVNDFHKIANASTPHKSSDQIRYKNPQKRKSPDTQEDSLAKLIPKFDEPPMKRQKPPKDKKKKRIWLFVSSSDEEAENDFWSDDDVNDQAKFTNQSERSLSAKSIDYKKLPSSKPVQKQNITAAAISIAASNSRLCLSSQGSKDKSDTKQDAIASNSNAGRIEKAAHGRKRQRPREATEAESSMLIEEKSRKKKNTTKEVISSAIDKRASKPSSRRSASTTSSGSRANKSRQHVEFIPEDSVANEPRSSRSSERSHSTRSSERSTSSKENIGTRKSKPVKEKDSKSKESQEPGPKGSRHSTRSSTIITDRRGGASLEMEKMVVKIKKIKIPSDELKAINEHAKRDRISRKLEEDNRPHTRERSSSANSKRDRTDASASLNKTNLDTSLNSTGSSRRSMRIPKPQIMFTRINMNGSIDYRDIVLRMGGKIVENIDLCTILVTDKIVRTCKFLCAMAKGIPIVSTDWLLEIKDKDYKIIDTDPFILQDPSAQTRFKFDLRKSLEAARQTPLLKNHIVYVTKSVVPPPDEIKEMVQCAGGRCVISLDDQPNAAECHKATVVVVSTNEDKMIWRQYKKILRSAPVVATEGLMLSIMRHHVDFKGFIFMK